MTLIFSATFFIPATPFLEELINITGSAMAPLPAKVSIFPDKQ